MVDFSFPSVQSFSISMKTNERVYCKAVSYYARDTRANETRSGPLSSVGCVDKKAGDELHLRLGKKVDPEKRHPEKVRGCMSADP